ncbi:MAG: outer membrane homotrimeric porin [Halodesulfovibrio sp.]|uniref:outer membrane homotrimeric porin n=1 Tax=Halodesulfovibrio sp. TaxID=1912772 RepID=UPI00359CE5BE
MKNLLCLFTLLLLSTLVITPVAAVEINARGSLWNVTQFLEHKNFQEDDETNGFTVQQRFRSQIEILATEMLSGVAYFEINHRWGQYPDNNSGRYAGGDISTDGVGVLTKRLFLHIDVPYFPLSINAGLIGLTYPGAVAGSVILDDDVAGIVASYAHSEKFSAALSWLRPFDVDTTDDLPVSSHNKMDMFLLSLYFAPENMNFNTYFAYTALGENVKFGRPNFTYVIGPSLGLDNSFVNVERTENAKVFWAGLALTANLDTDFKLLFDGIYGRLDANKAASRSGWFTAAKLSYTLDNITPALTGWWGSGDGSNAYKEGSGRMPFVTASWLISTYGFDDTHANETGVRIADATGKIGAGIVLDDITYISWMTQQLRVLGMWGTNDASIVKNGHLDTPSSNIAKYLTDKDFALEVDYEATIKLYDQLSISPSIAYIHLDLDEDTWGISNIRDSWRVALITKYTY